MSPVATETPTPGWGLGPTPAYAVIYTGKLHHDRGRYRIWLGCDGLVHVSQPVGRYRAMRLAARANRVERGLIQGYEGEEGPSPAPF